MATAGTLIGLLIAVAAPAQATTYIAARGGNGNERCLVGGDSFGQSGEIGKTCTGGGNYDGRESVVDLIINDIGGGLDWERVDDPNDSFFTFLSGAATTQVRGRARYAGYNNAFGATLLNGSYHELISGVPGNKVLLSDCTGITGCGTLNTDFVDLGQLIPGLLSGQPWKPTIDVDGTGTKIYTSLASDNYNGLDHMVAFKTVDPINNPQEDGFNAFNYILGFEDWRTLGDQDYNDFVLELSYSAVTSVPEPGAMALFGVGLLGAAGLRRRRVREATA
jgi:hypothetical protein